MDKLAEQQRVAAISAERDNYLAEIVKAAEAAGYTVTTTACGSNAKGIYLSSAKSAQWTLPLSVRTKCSNWWTRIGTNQVVVGEYGNKRYWTKLTPETVQKVLAYAKERLEVAIENERVNKIALKDHQAWQTRKNEELAGVVIPPTVRISIIEGNGPQAGRYAMRLHESGTGWRFYESMTLEQMKAVCAAFANIFGYDKMYVVQKMMPDGDGQPRPYWYSGVVGLREWVEDFSHATLIEDEAAAKAKAEEKDGKYMTYRDANWTRLGY